MDFTHVVHRCLLSGLYTIREFPLCSMSEHALKNLLQWKILQDEPELELEEASQVEDVATYVSLREGRIVTRLATPSGNRLEGGNSTDLRFLCSGVGYSFEIKCRGSFGSNAGLSGNLAGDIFRIETEETDGLILVASASSYQRLCRSVQTQSRGRKPKHYYNDLLPPFTSMDENLRRFPEREWHGAGYACIGAIVASPNAAEAHVLLCITNWGYVNENFPAWLAP